MKVLVNNKEREINQESSIKDLATEMQLPEKGIAIAVNNKMVTRTEWANHLLNEGDTIVIIKAACGG